MKSLVVLIYLLMLTAFACNTDKEGYKTTESGLKYKFISSSEGRKAEIGDRMKMHIAYYTSWDSLLYDSKVFGDSLAVELVNPTFPGGVEEGFAMMSPGDSALFKVSADSLFEKTFMGALPVYMKKGESVYFRVKLFDIVPGAIVDSLARVKDIEMRREEFRKLEKYLSDNNMEGVMPTKNGAYLSVTKAGSGDYPQTGDTVYVEYTGTLIDGTVFDKSVDADPPFSFVLGNGMVIEGWEECMPLMNAGSEAKMVLPSDLAYGSENIGMLPGYSSLIFDVKIIKIVKGKKNLNQHE